MFEFKVSIWTTVIWVRALYYLINLRWDDCYSDICYKMSEFEVFCWTRTKEEKRRMRANRRQITRWITYNPKLVRLAQVPHRTSNREGSTLARRNWQPPHNVGTPQTMKHTRQTMKQRHFTIHDLRSGSRWIRAGGNSI